MKLAMMQKALMMVALMMQKATMPAMAMVDALTSAGIPADRQALARVSTGY